MNRIHLLRLFSTNSPSNNESIRFVCGLINELERRKITWAQIEPNGEIQGWLTESDPAPVRFPSLPTSIKGGVSTLSLDVQDGFKRRSFVVTTRDVDEDVFLCVVELQDGSDTLWRTWTESEYRIFCKAAVGLGSIGYNPVEETKTEESDGETER